MPEPGSLHSIEQELTILSTPGLESSDPFQTAARKVLLFQFGQMLLNQPIALLGEDIEGVHKMRVAVRRIRTMLRYLRPVFKQAPFKPFRHWFKETGTDLGRIRDMDVIKLVLENQGLVDEAHWETYFSGEYSELRSTLKQIIETPEHRENCIDFYHALHDQIWNFKNDVPGYYLQGIQHFFPQMTAQKWQQIFSGFDHLKPEPYSRLHELRKELKHLRYLIEFFSEVTDPQQTEVVILKMISLQDRLGELNDLHNAAHLMESRLEGHPQESELLRVVETLRSIRDKSASNFVAEWEPFRTSDFHMELQQLMPLT